MNVEYYRTHCLSKVGVEEGFPFDTSTLVFKVGGKIFALLDIEEFVSVNLKCDPEYAIELRERYEGILPGYHMNKRHWNTILNDGSVSDKLLLELTDHSYDLVYQSLPAKVKSNLAS
ncbi:MmcQ/YjbR family DNA-binding protein [Penaeicola halotolerans]|uniref:MmcQ/YjbR family DNA-binding protein n=1 Tax=Penaeicola halotolerans TaxID=2793196 RepID=UPI001CF84B6E|nr:MmcQ/YjbR family DNA-binding protein [Penaeicola halotolerans]